MVCCLAGVYLDIALLYLLKAQNGEYIVNSIVKCAEALANYHELSQSMEADAAAWEVTDADSTSQLQKNPMSTLQTLAQELRSVVATAQRVHLDNSGMTRIWSKLLVSHPFLKGSKK